MFIQITSHRESLGYNWPSSSEEDEKAKDDDNRQLTIV